MEKPLTTRKRQALEMRSRIQYVALDLFDRDGFENVSVEQIAQAAGCSVGNIYHYFKSKDELIIHVTSSVDAQYEVLERAGGAEISAALAAHGAVCVGETSAEGKLGPPSLSFDALARLADYVLVEADGSRRLPLKAHAPHEPVIPANAQRVVLVVGADGFGKPIRDVCHRSERYAALCGVSENALVTPELEAALILAEGLGDRVYINKVESAADYEAAQTMAREFSCPVIAGSLHQGVYVCLY